MGEDVRVISADGTVFLEEICPSDGMALGRGELLLKLLLSKGDGDAELMTRRLPLEGQVELEGMTADGMCTMSGTVSELTVTVEEGRILCEIGVLLSARGLCNRRMSYTADLYSTAVESDCEYRSSDVPVALKCEKGNLSQSERIPLEGLNVPKGALVVDSLGTVLFDGCEQENSTYVLTGQSRYQLLCQKDGEYSVAEVTVPLRYEMKGEGQVPTCYDAVGEVLSCRVRMEGDTLCLDAELSVTADFVGSTELRYVSAVHFGEPLDCRDNRMVVYYPMPEDTAWTVAKKYHISPEKLSEGASYYLL